MIRSVVLVLLVLAGIVWWRRPVAAPEINPERQFELYDYARYLGRNDNLTPRPRDPERYASQFAEYADLPNARDLYRDGYNDGFDQHPEEPMSLDECSYDQDYRKALRDRAKGMLAADNRSLGYLDAANHKPHRFGRPYR